MINIAIGTNSAYKIHAIKKALYEIDFDFNAVHGSTNSGISEQPHKPGETKKGSINRARNILGNNPESDLGLGVEFGYEPIEEKFYMVCWATVITSDGKVFSEQSSTLELPPMFNENLIHDMDISDDLDKVLNKLDESKESHRVFKQFIWKRRVIYESVSNVMLRYLLDKEIYNG